MAKRAVSSDKLPGVFGNYSSAVVVGDMMFLAGHGPFDVDKKLVGEGDITAQTRKTLENIRILLTENGFQMNDVVRATVYLQHIEDWGRLNAVFGEFFTAPYPARCVVACQLNGFLVEIECTAIRGCSGAKDG